MELSSSLLYQILAKSKIKLSVDNLISKTNFWFQKPLENFDTNRAQPHFKAENGAGRGGNICSKAAKIYKSGGKAAAIIKMS